MNLDDYTRWLTEQGFRPATIEATLRAVLRQRRQGAALRGSDAPHLKRYLLYVERTRREPLGEAFTKSLYALGLVAAQERNKCGHTRVQDPPTAAQVSALKERLRRCGDVGRLALIYMQSGLRVGAFLRISFKGAFTIYPLHAAWLKEACDRTNAKRLYQILSSSKRKAYRQLDARVRKEAAALDFEAGLDTLYKSRLQLR